jgi:predicted nuclease of predicted toxin-antitoxin system
MNLSPDWVRVFEGVGWEALHWSSVGDISAPDTLIMDWARERDFAVFTHDLDYGTLLFVTQASSPSVIQLRAEDVRPSRMADVVLEVIQVSTQELLQGALVTIDPRKRRVRLLPFRTENS